MQHSRTAPQLISRGGNAGLKRLHVLRLRDTILHTNRNQKSLADIKIPEAFNKKSKDPQIDAIAAEMARELKSRETQIQRPTSAVSKNFIFKQQSRNDYQEAYRDKNKIPPVGTYTPQHMQVLNRAPRARLDDSWQKGLEFPATNTPDPGHHDIPAQRYEGKKIANFSQFHKRKPLYDTKNGPCEKRFLNTSESLMSNQCTKYRKSQTLQLEKHRPRAKLWISTTPENANFYDIKCNQNFDGKVPTPNLRRTTKRRPPGHQSITPVCYDGNPEAVEPYPKASHFGRDRERDPDPDSKYPGYMQEYYMRDNLQDTSKKMIEMN